METADPLLLNSPDRVLVAGDCVMLASTHQWIFYSSWFVGLITFFACWSLLGRYFGIDTDRISAQARESLPSLGIMFPAIGAGIAVWIALARALPLLFC